MATTKRALSIGGKALGPYSSAVAHSSMVVVSGQLPMDPSTGDIAKVPLGEKCKLVLEAIKGLLALEGLGLEHVVKTTVFLTDLGDFAEMNQAYEGYFSAPYPARSTIQVAALPKGSPIEIEAIAMRD